VTDDVASDARPLPWWLWAVPVLWSGAFLTGDRALRQLLPEAISFARFTVAVLAGVPLLARLAGAWGRGESLCLAAAFAWASYAVLKQRLRAGPLRGLPGPGVTALHYVLTAAGTLPFALRGGHLRELAAADLRVWACVVYIGVLSTVIAYTLYNAALDRVGSARTAPVAYAVPALTTALSWAIDGGAHLTWRTPGGIALVTLGLVVTDGRALRALKGG